jgi:hypothetical protein
MNRLGMLVDLSHVSDETMKDAIRISQGAGHLSHSARPGPWPIIRGTCPTTCCGWSRKTAAW